MVDEGVDFKKTDITNAVTDLTVLEVDPARVRLLPTGVVVRARLRGRWVTADVATLDRRSLLAWLRSRGGQNPWAEDFLGYLLGHGALTDSAGAPLKQADAPGNDPDRPS